MLRSELDDRSRSRVFGILSFDEDLRGAYFGFVGCVSVVYDINRHWVLLVRWFKDLLIGASVWVSCQGRLCYA